MKKFAVLSIIVFCLLGIFSFAGYTEASARYGSIRVGGYTSHGKGSHYIGGYVRTAYTSKYYLTH